MNSALPICFVLFLKNVPFKESFAIHRDGSGREPRFLGVNPEPELISLTRDAATEGKRKFRANAARSTLTPPREQLPAACAAAPWGSCGHQAQPPSTEEPELGHTPLAPARAPPVTSPCSPKVYTDVVKA